MGNFASPKAMLSALITWPAKGRLTLNSSCFVVDGLVMLGGVKNVSVLEQRILN